MICFIGNYTVQSCEQSTLEEAVAYLSTCDKIAVDTETTGLDPFTSKVVMLQVGDESKQFVIDCRVIDPTALKELLESRKIQKVLVNAKFDYKMLAYHFGIRLENVVDCMLQEQVILGAQRGSLYNMEVLAAKYLGFKFGGAQLSLFNDEIRKDTRSEFIHIGEQQFSPTQVRYGANDLVTTLKIAAAQQPVIDRDELNVCVSLENEFVLCLGDMELNGFHLDKDKWMETYEESRRRLGWTSYILSEWLTDNNLDEFHGINWNSTKQVVELFKTVGIPTQVVDKVKSRGKQDPIYKDSVEKSHIKKYKKEYPIVALYLRYKELVKATTSYGEAFLRHLHPKTGRIHSSYRQILNTGRISSNGPNLQNITRGSRFRKCFTPQSEKTTLLVADYKSQESRIMADKANDQVMIDFFLRGDGDIHSYTARQMWNHFVDADTHPILRFRAKILNFGIPYGISAFKLARDFEISVREAEDFISRWFKSYPNIEKYFESSRRFVIDNGYIVIDGITKRRYYCHNYHLYLHCRDWINYRLARKWEVPKIYWSTYFSLKGKFEREAQNYKIQGTGASMTKLASIYIRQHIRDNSLWDYIKQVNIVHDEIILEVTKDCTDEAKAQVIKAMERAGKKFIHHIPMPVDAKVSTQWEH